MGDKRCTHTFWTELQATVKSLNLWLLKNQVISMGWRHRPRSTSLPKRGQQLVHTAEHTVDFQNISADLAGLLSMQ